MKGFGFFGNKHEEAAELYEKAANNFKLGKCWAEATECYVALAECNIKMDSKHEAATAYVEASKCAAKNKPEQATALLHKAVALYTDMGRLNMAARQLREIAEVNEKSGNKAEAITFYDQAADLFETEGSNAEATKCKLKIAEFAGELGHYKKAVELFEEAAKRAVENNLLKFSARGYLLNAGICYMCYASADDLEIKIAKYKDIDLQFDGSREAMLLDQCCEAFQMLDSKSVERFATALGEFDRMIRLDAWKTKILLAAKRRLESMIEGDEDSEDDIT
jgi:alpha-soluble NSF attachment protein